MTLDRVYAIYGKANSGKTSALNELIRILKEHSHTEVLFKNIHDDEKIAVFEVEGNNIGVITQGDCEYQLKNHLGEIQDKCNIIFCPTRTKGKTCDFVANRFEEKLIWIQKSRIEDNVSGSNDLELLYGYSNSYMAKLLYSMIISKNNKL